MMMNPVLRRETKTTLRNWKMFAVITVYVAVVTIGAMLYIYGSMFRSYDYSFDPQSMIGMYIVLCSMQMGLMLLAAPALTAGCISGERERQTLDLLLMTKMSSFSIIMGKLTSSMSTLILLMVSTLPVFAIAFYFGGVSLLSLFGMMLYIVLTACMAASISIFFSCIFKKTMVSMVIVYLLIGGIFCFGTLIIALLLNSLSWNIYQSIANIVPQMLILSANPGVGFFSVIQEQMGNDFIGSIFYQSSNKYSDTITFLLNHYWIVNVIFDVIVICIFVSLSVYFINPVRKKK